MASKKVVSMPVNKSALIRELLSANPQISAAEIISSLAARDIRVQPSLVYSIKSGAKSGGAKTKKETAAPLRTPAVESNGSTLDHATAVMEVRELASRLGGFSALRALAAVLET